MHYRSIVFRCDNRNSEKEVLMKKIIIIICFLVQSLLVQSYAQWWWAFSPDSQPDTLGVELIVNGNMELNSNWTAFGIEAGDSVNQSTTFAYSPTHSWRLKTNTDEGIISDDISLVSGQVYYLVFWVKSEFVDNYRIRTTSYYGNEGGTYTSDYISDSNWHKIVIKRTVTGTGNGKVWLFQHDGTKTNIYIDNVSLKQKIN